MLGDVVSDPEKSDAVSLLFDCSLELLLLSLKLLQESSLLILGEGLDLGDDIISAFSDRLLEAVLSVFLLVEVLEKLFFEKDLEVLLGGGSFR